ncbi:MAG: hypothetical protein LBS84_13380, partial [Clostridiales bacterium]|nr:hypothetical protein [Clostridiales bacterium]
PRWFTQAQTLSIKVKASGTGIKAALYALDGGRLSLMKNVNGTYVTLASVPLNYAVGEAVPLRVSCRLNKIQIFSGGNIALISYSDSDAPYLTGCVGAALGRGASARFGKLKIRAFA